MRVETERRACELRTDAVGSGLSIDVIPGGATTDMHEAGYGINEHVLKVLREV